MSPKKRFMLRGVILAAWLLMALIVVGPVLAQGEGTVGGQDPSDLDDIVVQLTPLLVGAALIERTIEVLFTWTERALIDAGHWLNRLAEALTGLVSVDLRHAWDEVSQLTNAMLTRQAEAPTAEAFEGNSDSVDPTKWPLAMLEEKLKEAKGRVETAQTVMENSLKSPEFVAQKKVMAAVLSMIMGLGLALVGNLRLFQPIGVNAASWFGDPFDVIDLLMAGILMGLGTEWVHQLIEILIKGKDALGRVGVVNAPTGASAEIDLEQVRMLTEQIVNQELKTQLTQLQGDLSKEVVKAVSAIAAQASSGGSVGTVSADITSPVSDTAPS